MYYDFYSDSIPPCCLLSLLVDDVLRSRSVRFVLSGWLTREAAAFSRLRAVSRYKRANPSSAQSTAEHRAIRLLNATKRADNKGIDRTASQKQQPTLPCHSYHSHTHRNSCIRHQCEKCTNLIVHCCSSFSAARSVRKVSALTLTWSLTSVASGCHCRCQSVCLFH